MSEKAVLQREPSSVRDVDTSFPLGLGSTPSNLKPNSRTQKILLRRKTKVIGTGQRVASHFLFEWSLGNGKWYSINSRNVIPASLDDEGFVERYREAMNRVIQGETVEIRANYVPVAKVLLVKEVAEA